jgi:penicillin-binding protein 1A
MESILVKILAVVLALSQTSTRPEDVKTHFDPVADRTQVVELLRAGCAHMRKVFEVEDLQLDDLISTALADPQAVTGDIKAFRGLNFNDLHATYREFCKNETVDPSPVDVGQLIAFYDKAAADLPDHTRLKGLRLPGPTTVLDGKGAYFAELYEPGNRRISVPLSDIPPVVQHAFISAEDKRFYEHKGIDERGLVRAFVVNMMQPGRPQGGSTITQQMVKNLLVGDDVTYERKIREIIVTSRVERTLSKSEILELYLNSIYFGRNSWGIEMAARSYFGKSAKDLTLGEAALLAGLVKGPNYFNPDRFPDRARERMAYVLGRMQEDGVVSADEAKQAQGALPAVVAYERPRNDVGRYFFDYMTREVKTLPGLQPLTSATYTIRSTIRPDLQKATEAALQEGLAQYEMSTGRVDFQGPEANLTEAIKQIEAARSGTPSTSASKPASKPAWQEALDNARLPLDDVQWLPAVVVEKPGASRGGALKVGLADGRVLPLRASGHIARRLQLNDVVFVRVTEGKGKSAARADLRVRPAVQGAALVLDNKTGRILAMAGGFSYPLSQLNRTSQTRRQPGSSIKPLTYLAALRAGLQPNTLVRDEPITLPPLGNGVARERDYWSPKNYDGGSSGVLTLRRALENSRNLATVGLLDGGIADSPERSLDRVCELAEEARIYSECLHLYPVVLGAQPVRLIDLAAFYAAIASEGARPTPHAIETVEQDGRTVYRDDTLAPTWIGSADRASFYQLKSMLQGVVQRGTANSIRQLAPYVAGKTGTSDEENDAWFVGFSNDVTVAVWVGYDNGSGAGRRTLGGGETGGKVAVPIFESIMKAAWTTYAPQTALSPPSPEAKRQLVSLPIDLWSGSRIDGRGGERAFNEYFHLDARGHLDDTQYRIVGEEEADSLRQRDYGDEASYGQQQYGGYPYGQYQQYQYGQYPYGQYGRRGYPYSNGPIAQGPPGYRPEPQGPSQFFRGLFGGWMNEEQDRQREQPQPPQRRYDPDYFWHNRMN